jgi:hypothetical protein
MLHYPEEDYVDDEELVSSSSPTATMIRSASALGLATQVINPDTFSLRIYECREFVLLISKIMHVSMMIRRPPPPHPAADAAAEANIEPRGICTTPSS